MSDLVQLMDRAIQAVLSAGTEILDIYGTTFSVAYKGDRSPITLADRRAHAAILQNLASTGLPVLSEEGDGVSREERQAWQRYWLVDPLDGTREFVKRNGEFTVNIALMEQEGGPPGGGGGAVPVAGVLYVPVQDVLYFAWRGGGAYREEAATTRTAFSTYERAAMAVRLPIVHHRERYTITTSRSVHGPEIDAFIASKEQEHGMVAHIVMGSALKICLVAEGRADVYPRYAPTMEWDTAAGHAICLEAGRNITDMTTDAPMRYNKNELVNHWFIVE